MAEKKYLNDQGLADVASHVNSRLKTVTTMPVSADDGAVRLYVGSTDTYIKGHTYQYVSEDSVWEDITPTADVSGKADKVSNATNGDLAGLNGSGNLTDSGILISDVATKVSSATNGNLAGLNSSGNITDSGIATSNVVTKSSTTGLIKNDGSIDTNTYATTSNLSSKADKVTSATANDFAALDSNGNLIDSNINKNIVPSGATSSNKLATTNDIPTELNDLSDDVVITSPQNAQVLTYNSTSGKWENQTGGGSVGGATFQGSILFANLPTTGMQNGDWYDIKDAFTTDNRFEEGSGIPCAAGTDVIWVSADTKWNILTPSGVYSFNGRNGAVVPASGDYDIGDLGDISISSATNGQPLTYDSANSEWTNGGIIPIDNGGTGNAYGYIRTGQKINTTVGSNATCEGDDTTASGMYSHAEGYKTVASGNGCHAEGGNTTATNYYSHAEGDNTTANNRSHAEGNYTTANNYSHAEGDHSEASGAATHAEGYYTTASANYTHAEGYHTTAGYANQHVQGKYNNNKSDTIFEIGNGVTGTPQNAFEVYDTGLISQDDGTSTYGIYITGSVTASAGNTYVGLYHPKITLTSIIIPVSLNVSTTGITPIAITKVQQLSSSGGENRGIRIYFQPLETATTFRFIIINGTGINPS